MKDVITTAGAGGRPPLLTALPALPRPVSAIATITASASLPSGAATAASTSHSPLATVRAPAASSAAAAPIALALEEGDQLVDIHRARHGRAVVAGGQPLRRVVTS